MRGAAQESYRNPNPNPNPKQVSAHWAGKTDHTSARAVLRAICILRAHTLNLQGGPAFTLDGMPLPTTRWQVPLTPKTLTLTLTVPNPNPS